MTTCIIPARGGSKRIRAKNIKDFCGKPIINWSISTALDSGCFDRVVVSTDDCEIAETARLCGAETPFKRPKELADDYTPTREVIAHTIEKLELSGAICCLYATAPFVLANDFHVALSLLKKDDVRYVFTVTKYKSPVQRALRMMPDNYLQMLQPEYFSKRTQDLEAAWHDAGQFYFATAEKWCQDLPIFGPGAQGIPVPQTRAQDIDTEEDWEFAELLFQAQRHFS